MKTATQKIVEEWHNKKEKEKEKVKEISYYKKIISKEDKKIIKKMYKVLEIIKEEMTLFSDYEKYDVPFGSVIDKNKLLENKILISDFKKIISLLRSSRFIVIPKNNGWSSDEKLKEMEKEIFVLFPQNDPCDEIEEECSKYPYEQNFKNLNKAIKEVIYPKENLKTNNYNVVFDKNRTRIKDIATNYSGKKWFPPNNFLLWITGTIITAVIAGLILNWLLK